MGLFLGGTVTDFERAVMRLVVISKHRALRRRYRARFLRVRAHYW